MSHGWVHDPTTAEFAHARPEALTAGVGSVVQTGRAVWTPIVEPGEVLAVDVGVEQPIRDGVLVSGGGLAQVLDPVVGDLVDASSGVDGAVPGTAPTSDVETRPLPWVGEGGVDDLAEGDAEHDVGSSQAARVALFLGLQTTVRRGGELDELLQVVIIVGEGAQSVLRLGSGVLARDQAAGVIECHRGQTWPARGCCAHRPPRRPSSRARTCNIAGIPPASMTSSGVLPPKIGLLFGRFTHSSARAPGWSTCSAV